MKALPRGSALPVPPLTPKQRAAIAELREQTRADVRDDDVSRALYATDASIYELVPLGVILPRTREDVAAALRICARHKLPVTPRTAGTSLAGQAVGPGFVLDIGRYMTRIIDVDVENRTVRVEPGVIRDELNRVLKPTGLQFGPDTSTSNRCMLGGMIGNNSCGVHSILYGTTRDNLVSLDLVTVDGELNRVGALSAAEWEVRAQSHDVLGRGLRTLGAIVRENTAAIHQVFPKPSIVRRNTGYPLDDLANSALGDNPGRQPDLARFFCGTEGTLGVVVEATLELVPIPKKNLVVVAHFNSLDESMRATVIAVRHKPAAVELMDKRILDLAALNPEQQRNRFFLQGDPAALLAIEFYGDTEAELEQRARALIVDFEGNSLGYAFPLVHPPEITRVWNLRNAGLGVLSGAPGDIKPVTLVEDTAVAVEDLPAFIRDFGRIMAEHNAQSVYYAHASVGELHLRPELNFKDKHDIERGVSIAEAVADLVREYRGSLSGEHGDGRLRGPYIERVMGKEAVGWFAQVKAAFDPDGILNPGNIVDPAPMTDSWRYHQEYRDVTFDTEFAYEDAQGFQRAVERCNGTGVCRRLHTAGGTMCPSYMVTHEEHDTTRGRANLFRLLIQKGPDALYNSTELKDALDLCVSCKGCRSDCPASVDMATLKAEFTQGWMDRNGTPLGSWLVANVTELGRPTQWIPGSARFANAMQRSRLFRGAMRRMAGFTEKRPMPAFAAKSFRSLKRSCLREVENPVGRVALFVDEFTDRYEPELAVAAVELLQAGGYNVVVPDVGPSGRTWLSKGFVREARRRIVHNLRVLEPLLDAVDAIVGVEPSAILTFVDEGVDLPKLPEDRALARRVAEKTRLVEQFVVEAHARGAFRARFTDAKRKVVLHGHCMQKATVGAEVSRKALSLPPGFTVELVPSGCCGMAGSFGYEDKHYDVSMQMGELVLFPAVRAAADDTILAAPGTSCRHQIHDGTGRTAEHPVRILRDALA
jgi:FAD/FMN-containing dehydrogenase/Fe-S oxidoreductase